MEGRWHGQRSSANRCGWAVGDATPENGGRDPLRLQLIGQRFVLLAAHSMATSSVENLVAIVLVTSSTGHSETAYQ
eukprot:53887-Rhodomonas_salina.1